MNLPPERIAELMKLANQPPLINEIAKMPLKDRAIKIQDTARIVLGIEAHKDINELREPARSELLLSMTVLRNNIVEART